VQSRERWAAELKASSFRFGGDGPTRTSVLTSAVLENAAANLCTTFEEARAALRRSRQSDTSKRRR